MLKFVRRLFLRRRKLLVIHPDECIDCGVCEPECPADAIKADVDVDDSEYWVELNRKYSEQWPNIVDMCDSLPDADAYNRSKGYDGPDKMQELSENPGKGS